MMSPPSPVDLSALAGVMGVQGYILVDAHGSPIAQTDEAAIGALAPVLVQWGKRCAKVGKGFRYLAFTRKNGERMAMFRVGTAFLGVSLSKQSDSPSSLEEIVTIIKSLS